jgi:gamma-glutamyltranspeptidase
MGAVLAAGAHAQAPPPEAPSGWTDKEPVAGRRFMVSAGNPLAVKTGYDVLAKEDTATDAAIARHLVLGLVQRQASGIGAAREPRLRALGHDTVVIDQTSGTQVIVRTPQVWVGGADPRKEGVVTGE